MPGSSVTTASTRAERESRSSVGLDAVNGVEDRPAVGRGAQLVGELVAPGGGDEDVSHGGP